MTHHNAGAAFESPFRRLTEQDFPDDQFILQSLGREYDLRPQFREHVNAQLDVFTNMAAENPQPPDGAMQSMLDATAVHAGRFNTSNGMRCSLTAEWNVQYLIDPSDISPLLTDYAFLQGAPSLQLNIQLDMADYHKLVPPDIIDAISATTLPHGKLPPITLPKKSILDVSGDRTHYFPGRFEYSSAALSDITQRIGSAVVTYAEARQDNVVCRTDLAVGDVLELGIEAPGIHVFSGEAHKQSGSWVADSQASLIGIRALSAVFDKFH